MEPNFNVCVSANLDNGDHTYGLTETAQSLATTYHQTQAAGTTTSVCFSNFSGFQHQQQQRRQQQEQREGAHQMQQQRQQQVQYEGTPFLFPSPISATEIGRPNISQPFSNDLHLSDNDPRFNLTANKPNNPNYRTGQQDFPHWCNDYANNSNVYLSSPSNNANFSSAFACSNDMYRSEQNPVYENQNLNNRNRVGFFSNDGNNPARLGNNYFNPPLYNDNVNYPRRNCFAPQLNTYAHDIPPPSFDIHDITRSVQKFETFFRLQFITDDRVKWRYLISALQKSGEDLLIDFDLACKGKPLSYQTLLEYLKRQQSPKFEKQSIIDFTENYDFRKSSIPLDSVWRQVEKGKSFSPEEMQKYIAYFILTNNRDQRFKQLIQHQLPLPFDIFKRECNRICLEYTQKNHDIPYPSQKSYRGDPTNKNFKNDKNLNKSSWCSYHTELGLKARNCEGSGCPLEKLAGNVISKNKPQQSEQGNAHPNA